MKKKIILMLVTAMLASFAPCVYAEKTDDTETASVQTTADTEEVSDETTTETTTDETSDETDTTTDIESDETTTDTTDETTSDTSDDTTTDTESDTTTDTDSSTSDDTTTDTESSSNILTGILDTVLGNLIDKDTILEKKAELEKLKDNAAAYVKSAKELIKSAVGEVRQELLEELSKFKKENLDTSIDTFINGLEVDYSNYDNVLPYIVNGTTLVPIRAVAEALGAEVSWDGDTRTVTVTKNGNVVSMQLDSKTVTVNGKEIELTAAPTLNSGRTMVPIRVISEGLNYTVNWDGEGYIITIDSEE